MKKTGALALAILMLLSTLLFSCSEEKSEVVIKYGDAEYDERLFMYELSRYKIELLSSLGLDRDAPELWQTSMGTGSNGNVITVGDYFYQECLLNMRITLFFADYAMKNGGDITSEQKKNIDSQMDTLVESFGSKDEVNDILEEYGINYDLYRDHLEIQQLSVNGMTLAYSKGGERYIPVDKEREYYKDNFITVKHITVGTEIAGTDQEGNYIYYTDEEKAAKQEKIENIRARIAAGEDFDTLCLESEDNFLETYPKGYTITEGALTDEKEGYGKAAMLLDMEETTEWEMEGYGYYFIKRVELNEDDFEYCREYIYPILEKQDNVIAVAENAEKFVENSDIIASYSLTNAPI